MTTSTSALWRAHIERALRAAHRLKAGVPAPRLAFRDPFAVRALICVLVIATFIAAGDERMKRLAGDSSDKSPRIQGVVWIKAHFETTHHFERLPRQGSPYVDLARQRGWGIYDDQTALAD